MSPREALELARRLRPQVADERVLAAIASIPRERFVPADPAGPGLRERGAADRLRPDDLAAARRRPDARDCSSCSPSDRVLDVGTGLGLPRGAAGAARRPTCGRSSAIESLSALAERDDRRASGSTTSRSSSATAGTGCPTRPRSTRSMSPPRPREYRRALEHQLAAGGRLVAPVGDHRRAAPGAVRRDARRRIARGSSSRSGSCRSCPARSE